MVYCQAPITNTNRTNYSATVSVAEFLYFRAKLIWIENVILTKRFVSVVVVNENSTPHNAFGISKEFTVYAYDLPPQTL